MQNILLLMRVLVLISNVPQYSILNISVYFSCCAMHSNLFEWIESNMANLWLFYNDLKQKSNAAFIMANVKYKLCIEYYISIEMVALNA